MRWGRTLGWAMVVAIACASSAAAQARTALSWVRDAGAESCIGAPELGARVEKLVGPVLVPAPSGEVSVEGRITREGARYLAVIAISDAKGALLGERVVQGQPALPGQEPDCRALDDHLAFVIAVAIDPNAALAEIPGELAPEGDPGAELLADLRANPPAPAPLPERAAPEAKEQLTIKPAPDEAPRLRGALAAGAFAGTGMLPAINAGASFELGLGLDWFMQRARLSLSASQRQPIEAPAEVLFGWLELGTASCVELMLLPAVALDVCGGASFTRLIAEPRGFPGTHRASWLVGPRVDARLGWLFSEPLALVLELSAASHFPKHRVSYESARVPRQVHAVPTLSGTLALLVELRL